MLLLRSTATLVEFLVASVLLESILGLQCFDTCFEDCSLPKCFGKCGVFGNVSQVGGSFRLPGYIGVECRRPGDKCAYREFTAIRGGADTFALTTPAGCLFEYVDVKDPVNNWDLSLGTNLFSCEGDFCNTPPKVDCFSDEATNRPATDDENENSPVNSSEMISMSSSLT